jgi:hypothetical protein
LAARERTYRCVGGPYDGSLWTLADERHSRLTMQQDVPSASIQRGAPAKSRDGEAADYDVRRLLAPDGRWHEFLVLSTMTTMQATVWLNRRR